MRLIDADALIKQLAYCVKQGMGATIAYTFMHMIDDAPSAQPKTGEWYLDEERGATGIYMICSACEECIYIAGDFKYCPNCGAKMKGADDEHP